MRALRLAPVLLLALAACAVDTDSLKPKTDAECAATGMKACGYKCVAMSERCGRALTQAECAAVDPATKACGNACLSINDPAAGCSNYDCNPCPNGPLGEAATCSAGLCSYVPNTGGCSLPKILCGAECVELRSSTLHCGACDHVCPSGATCTGGLCSPFQVVQANPTTSPREVTCQETGWVGFLDVNSNAWVTPDALYPASFNPIPMFAGPFGGSPRITSSSDLSLPPALYFAGRDQPGSGGAIWEYDTALVPAANVPIAGAPSESFSGLAISDAWAYFTQAETGRSLVRWVGRGSNPGAGGLDYYGMTPDVGPITGVATVYRAASGSWHAFAIAGRAIIQIDEAAGVPVDGGIVSLADRADRIAATMNPASGAIRLYLADSTTGRLWLFDEGAAAPTLITGATGPGGHLDLVADPLGAYWTLATASLVMEYRASDGAVFPLADATTTGQPWSLCLGPWSGYVSWSDATMDDVRAVSK